MKQKFNNYLKSFSFLTAFPGLLLFGINISFFFFIRIFIKNKGVKINKLKSFNLPLLFLVFFIGCIISTINSNAYNGFYNSLLVLPNYLYWCILCLLFFNINELIDYTLIAKHLLYGILTSILYFFSFDYLPSIPFLFNKLSLNTFAFLCILFTPPAINYLVVRGNRLIAIATFIFILSVLLILGRRAGFVIVLATGLLSLLLRSIKPKSIILGILGIVIISIIMQLDSIKNLISDNSSRIFELIYSNENLLSQDKSYLTRRLMIEKAILIFEEHPLTGIGLNNFMNYEVDFIGDFEGANYVLNKAGRNSISAHNSYLAILSEGGLLMFIPFILIILFNIIYFIKNYNKRTVMLNSFYWAFCGMCIHLYFISTIVNVYAWFIIGIVSSISLLKKNHFKNLVTYNT